MSSGERNTARLSGPDGATRGTHRRRQWGVKLPVVGAILVASVASAPGMTSVALADVPTQSAPAITSAGAAVFVDGRANTFTVTTTGLPTPSLSESGLLPVWITFVDNGNGTATIAGDPPAGTGDEFPITITAANGVAPAAAESFDISDRVPATTVAAQFGDGESCVSTPVSVSWPAASVPGLSGYLAQVYYYQDGVPVAGPAASVAGNQTTASMTLPSVPGQDPVVVSAEVLGSDGPVIASGTVATEAAPTAMTWDVDPAPGSQATDTGPVSSVGDGTVTINADMSPTETEYFVQPYTSATITISPGGASLPGPQATFSDLTNGQEYSFTQTLSNECGTTTTTIGNAVPEDVVVTAPQETTATVGDDFSQSFAASGGTAPYEYTLSPGAPPGLSFDSQTGNLSGDPTTQGQYDLSVSVADSLGSGGMPPLAQPATATYDLTIGPSTQAPYSPPPPAPPVATTSTATPTTSTTTTTTVTTVPTTTTTVKAKATVAVAKVDIVSSSTAAAKGLLPVKLSCAGAACTGSVEVIGKASPKLAQPGAAAHTVVLAKGTYSIALGGEATVMLKLTATGRTVVSAATRTHPLSGKVEVSVKGGASTTKAVHIS